jgi:hypothetical protein
MHWAGKIAQTFSGYFTPIAQHQSQVFIGFQLKVSQSTRMRTPKRADASIIQKSRNYNKNIAVVSSNRSENATCSMFEIIEQTYIVIKAQEQKNSNILR